MLAATVLAFAAGLVQDPALFELLTYGFVRTCVADPELGLYLENRNRVTLTTGKMADAAKSWRLEQRWRPLGRTGDGRFWVVLDAPIRFPLRLFAWDGTAWSEGEVVLDRRAREQIAQWKRDNAVFTNDARPARVGSKLFVRDRLGVYAYANAGRWRYRSFVPEPGKPFVIGQADEAAHRVGDAGDAYFYRRGHPARIYHWDGDSWGFAKAFPSGLPAKYEPVFRVGPSTWIGFHSGKAIRVAGGKQAQLAFTQCMPLAQHPRDGTVLVRLRADRSVYASLDGDGNATELGPAHNTYVMLNDEHRVVTESAVYWTDRKRLLRWTKGRVLDRFIGDRRLLGLTPDRKAVFAAYSGTVAFAVPLAELDRQLAKAPKLEKHANAAGTARLDENGRMTRVHADAIAGLALHSKQTWRYERFAGGKWHTTPDTPTFTTWLCSLRWCRKCHTKPRIQKLLQQAKYPMPHYTAQMYNALRPDGTLVARLAGGWKPVEPPANAKPRVAALVRVESGALWLNSSVGLLRLTDKLGKLAVADYWLFDVPAAPLAVDCEDNVWFLSNREVTRLVSAGAGRSP